MTGEQLFIWHTEEASQPVQFAATELHAYLTRMGLPRARVAKAPAGSWPEHEVRISASSQLPRHESPMARMHELSRPVPPPYDTVPGRDAFLWSIGDRRGSIVGSNPRAVLYGVYDLLEHLGCRFFGPSPDDEVLPPDPDLSFSATDEHFAQASFPFRERHFLEWIDTAATLREIDHAAKQRINGFSFQIEDFAPDEVRWRNLLDNLVPEVAKRGLLPGLGEHGGYPLWLPPERYAAAHPEWYAQIDGKRVTSFGTSFSRRYQFCTENPEALATFLGNMEAFLRENPLIGIMHIAPEDNGRWCECELCAPVPVAERYQRIGNAIAARVHEVRPHAWVTHLVYANHVELPKDVKPSSDLNVSFVPFGRDFAFPITDPRSNQRFASTPWSLSLIRQWAALCAANGAGLVAHEKALRHRWITFRLLPLPHVQEDFRWWRELGAGGFNAPQEGEGWWVKHLNAYAVTRLMWNVDVPLEELVSDYFVRFWKAVAAEVRDIYVDIADALSDLRYTRRSQPAILDNHSEGVWIPPREQWEPAVEYLEHAIPLLSEARQRVEALRRRGDVEVQVRSRLGKLSEAIEGAVASLGVSLAIRRSLLAAGSPGEQEVAREAAESHERFVTLQTPDRLAAGTLWTGAWRRDAWFAERLAQSSLHSANGEIGEIQEIVVADGNASGED